MTSKNTFATFGILAVLLMSLGMVSAADIDLFPEDYEISAIHDSTNTFTFKIYNENDTLSLVNLTSEISNLVGPETIGSSNITLSALPTSITADSNSSDITATVIIPKYISAGTYTGTIKIDGTFSEGSGATAKSLDLTTTITSSSELTITSIANLTKTTNGTIEVQNTGNVDLTGISLETTSSADFDVQFNDSDFDLEAGESILVKVSSIDAEDLDFRDDNTLNMRATNGSINSNTLTLTVDSFFYDGDNEGELAVSIDRIDVQDGFGDGESYWYPFDDIELKVTVDNNGEWDVQNIELQLCLLDVSKNKCILDEGDMELDDDNFDIDQGDDNSVLITFNVDPSNLKEGNTDYILYVSATGEVDDSDSDYDGDDTGASTSQEIEIRTTEEFIIFDQIILTDASNYNNNGETSCGSKLTLSANVWNIGDKDLDNDEIFVLVYNKELGISNIVSFNNGINAMDWELLETTFTIPLGASEKNYQIKLTAYDDEGIDDNDIYENKEDDKSEAYQSLKVTSCKASSITRPTISANLQSEAKVGEELIIKTIITNNDENNNFVISLSDFEDWATLISVAPQTASINKGEFVEVTIKLKPTTTGKHSFNINAIVNGESYSQPVSVNIAEESGIFPNISNTMLYIITGVVTLLIVIMLVWIVRISRRKTRPEF